MVNSKQKKIVPPDDLEVFDKRKPAPSEAPWVTRTKGGYFVFNPASFVGMGSPSAIEYLYSPKEQILGFRAADPDEPHTYPIYTQGHSKNFQSSAQAFHKHYGIPTDQTLRYQAELIAGTLYIDLKDEGAPPVGKRSETK